MSCHGPHIAPPDIKARNSPLKGADQPEWIMKTLCIDDIGTDPNTAINFYDARVDVTKTGMTAEDLRRIARKELTLYNQRESARLTAEIAQLKTHRRGTTRRSPTTRRRWPGSTPSMEQQLSEIDPTHLSVGAGLSYLGMLIREKAYADLHLTPAQQDDWDGFGRLDVPQVIAAYKPRPLAGMWATAPFLHNGSVPTVYDLLSPVKDRPPTFRVGSREYDTEKLGLKQPDSGFWVFDTSKRREPQHRPRVQQRLQAVEGRGSAGARPDRALPDARRAVRDHRAPQGPQRRPRRSEGAALPVTGEVQSAQAD